MKIALQPSANKDAQKHYIDTIQNRVHLDSIKNYISPLDYQELLKIYPDKELMIWGVTPINESKWKRIDEGRSISLFYKEKIFFSQSLITKKMHNKDLALKLWGVDAKDNTWEYIYFLSELSPLELDIKTFNKTVGYADNFVLQSFNVLHGEKAENLYFNIEEFQVLDYEIENSEEEYKVIIDKQFNGSLDVSSKSTIRKEQSYLRSQLFKKRKTAKCDLCHEEFPIQMLVAGHIKKRSKCSREEKLDATNIVMSICKFGCDELFEKGYVRINDDGKIYPNIGSGITTHVKEYINKISNNRCLKHNINTEVYFKWHRDFHESINI